MPNRLTTAVDNVTALTASVWNNEFDNLWSGTLSRTGGSLTHNDDVPMYLGTANDAVISFNTTQTQDALVIGVDTTSRTIIVCDNGDEATNFALAARSNPTIIVHGATAATNDYIEYSSDTVRFHAAAVAHGITTQQETDVYGVLKINNTASGALQIEGFGESAHGVVVRGYVVSDDTTKTTAAVGAVNIDGAKKSGTDIGAMGADGNILVIRNNTTAQFIFDIEGSAHANVEWTTFDDYDDIALINDFEKGVTQGFGEFLTYNREAIEAAGIAHFEEPGHAMVNFTRLSMLLCGALRQSAKRIAAIEQKLLEA